MNNVIDKMKVYDEERNRHEFCHSVYLSEYLPYQLKLTKISNQKKEDDLEDIERQLEDNLDL